jgi:cytidylate kinase
MSWGRQGSARVELQARYREILQRLAELGEQAAQRELGHGPWVTLSRQLGSRGTELAHRMSSPLGWRVYDREIIATIARQTHTPEKVVESRDERASGPFADYLGHLIVPTDPGQAGYLAGMMRVVGSIAREGRAIILGRGANFFLDASYGLRVRVVAPFEDRVARIAQSEGLEQQDAERRVEQNDSDQRGFIQQSFGRDIDDPLGYDLILNTGGMNLEDAGALVATALQRMLVTRQESSEGE